MFVCLIFACYTFTVNSPQAWNESRAECEKKLSAHKVGIKNLLQAMSDLEKECKNTKAANEANTAAEIARVRAQVQYVQTSSSDCANWRYAC